MMPDISSTTFVILLGAMVVMWLAQFALTYRQMRGFYRRLRLLNKKGLTAVGMNGGRYRGRAYGVLVVDEDNRIAHAESMGGWTVFASLRPEPDLVGMSLREVIENEETLPVAAKLRVAFANAARDLQAAREQESPDSALAGQLSLQT